MEHLYAPWRDEYVKNHDVKGCVFCHIVENPDLDKKNQVLYRDDICFIVMNLYPYTPGHFMIIPNKHTNNIETLSKKEWIHISSFVQDGVKMLKEFGAQGVNLGMNLGEEAGAGIAEHVHYHLVPRWSRDTNFITSIAGARVYSVDIEGVYRSLKELSKKYFYKK